MRSIKILLVIGSCAVLLGCGAMEAPESAHIEEAERLVYQGTVLLRQGRLEEARASYELAREVGNLPSALDGLGCVDLVEGEYRSAERWFLMALQVDPSYRTALANLGLLYDLVGRKEEAVRLYQAAITSAPLNYRIRNNLGAVLLDMELLEVALMKGAGDVPHLKARGLKELRKAAALAQHPIIVSNLAVARNK